MGRHQTIETRIKQSIQNGGDGKLRNLHKNCVNCQSPISYPKIKYCSINCQMQYQYEQKIKDWLNGKWNGVAHGGTSGYIKRYLLKKYNNKCSKCGWCEVNPHTGNIPLEVEHIDGDAFNNEPDNLTILCPNCHSLTKTYRGANKGNGRRKYVREYYKNHQKRK
jgi:hypothetical protein